MMPLPPPLIIALATLAATFLLCMLVKLLRIPVRPYAILGLCVTLIVFFFSSHEPVTYGLLAISRLGVLFAGLFVFTGLLVVIASREEDVGYTLSVLLAVAGMMLAANAGDLLLVYIAIELATVPLYALIAWGKSSHEIEAAVKYFLVSIIASVLILLGVGLVALDAGSSAIVDVHASARPMFLAGVAALLAGLGFKMGIFPFNFWIPDVYQGSSGPVAGLLAGASKKAGFAALLLLLPVLVHVGNFTLVVAVLAALTMLIPSLIALVQTDVRRLLAYSIMAHAGFLLMGIALGTAAGVAGLAAHSIAHAFMALGAFVALGVLASNKIDRIEEFLGLGYRAPLLAGALTIFLLGLAGIPLLSGFASKLYLFYAVGAGGMLWLTALAVFVSVLALYFYFRIIRAMYSGRAYGKPIEVRRGVVITILVCVFVTLFLGMYPVPLYDLAKWAAFGLL